MKWTSVSTERLVHVYIFISGLTCTCPPITACPHTSPQNPTTTTCSCPTTEKTNGTQRNSKLRIFRFC